MMHLEVFTFNPFSENTYLIYNDRSACLIDPGCNNAMEQSRLASFLKDRELSLESVLLTHAHVDHILGLAWVLDAYGLKATMHRLETSVFGGAMESAMLFGIRYEASPMPAFFEEGRKELVIIGELWEMREVPGHSPGSVAFIHHEKGWVIGGDALFQGSIGRTDLPGGDFPTLEQSIRTQLYSLPDHYVVFPGHGPQTTIARERAQNPYVRGV